jgi:hypothetical protein
MALGLFPIFPCPYHSAIERSSSPKYWRLTEGQTVQACEPSRINALSETRGVVYRKVLSHILSRGKNLSHVWLLQGWLQRAAVAKPSPPLTLDTAVTLPEEWIKAERYATNIILLSSVQPKVHGHIVDPYAQSGPLRARSDPNKKNSGPAARVDWLNIFYRLKSESVSCWVTGIWSARDHSCRRQIVTLLTNTKICTI